MASSSSSSSSTSPAPPRSFLLPYTTLQPTYLDVHADISSGSVSAEDVFLSVYAENAPSKSLHATLRLSQREGDTSASPPIALELIKGGKGLLSVKEADEGGEGEKGIARDLFVSTPGASTSAHPPTSPLHLQNSPHLPSHGVRLRLPCVTLSRLLKGTRSQAALDRGAGGSISAFDVAASEDDESGGYSFVVAGEEAECRLGSLVLPQKRAQSSTGSGRGDAIESVQEKAQRRMAEKRAAAAAQLKMVDVKGHVGDVTCARFFPSGKVILTSTNDGLIRLYPTSPPTSSPARQFKGHRRAVSSLSILGRGKRFLSSSRDGTLKLWDVPGGKCLRTLHTSRVSPVESLAILPLPAKDLPRDEGEATGSWLVLAGCANGSIEPFALRIDALPSPADEDEQPQVAIHSLSLPHIPPTTYPSDLPDGTTAPGSTDHWALVPSSAVWALDIMLAHHDNDDKQEGASSWIVAGTKTGLVRLFKIGREGMQRIGEMVGRMHEDRDEQEQSEEMPVIREHCIVRRNDSGVNAVRFVPSTTSRGPPDVVVATTDGTPYRLTWDAAQEDAALTPRVAEEYTGWEAGDAVEEIALLAREGEDVKVGLAGAEGCVRVY